MGEKLKLNLDSFYFLICNMISGLGKCSLALKLITTLKFEVLCFHWNIRLDYLKAKIKVVYGSNLIDVSVRISMNKSCYLA